MTTSPPTTHDETSSTPGERSPLQAAKSPVGVGAIGALGPILALLLMAAAIALIHDALVWGGVVSGTAWTQRLSTVNGLTPQQWTVPAGVVAVVVGLVLLVIALRRRPRRAIALAAKTGVYLRPADVARLARSRAQDVDGVLSARTTATRKAVTVTVSGTGADLEGPVRDAVTSRLSALESPPTVTVRTEGQRR